LLAQGWSLSWRRVGGRGKGGGGKEKGGAVGSPGVARVCVKGERRGGAVGGLSNGVQKGKRKASHHETSERAASKRIRGG